MKLAGTIWKSFFLRGNDFFKVYSILRLKGRCENMDRTLVLEQIALQRGVGINELDITIDNLTDEFIAGWAYQRYGQPWIRGVVSALHTNR